MTNETEALVFLGGLEVKRSGVLTAVALVTAVVQVLCLAQELLNAMRVVKKPPKTESELRQRSTAKPRIL